MRYQKIKQGIFMSRPNRFIALVEIEGLTETVHVKNTGRCRELLIPGCRVYVSCPEKLLRKTKYDLIAVEKQLSDGSYLLVNMDSQIPNDIAEEWLKEGKLFSKNVLIRREVFHGSSRFDFYVEDGDQKAFLEVKGCTLEQDGLAMFPDAPTERGVKHLQELTECTREGYRAYVLFVIQMKGVREFSPNDKMHPAFGQALRLAQQAGVQILAMDCTVTSNTIRIDTPIPVIL